MKASETNWESEQHLMYRPECVCPICGSSKYEVKPDTINLYGVELVVVKCPNCHHITLFEIPD